MKDMKAHAEKLRDQAAECALLSAEALTREKRELFARLNAHLTALADHVESVMGGVTAADSFLGRKTFGPFPREEE